MLNNIFFYLPMGYLLKTRLNSLAKFIMEEYNICISTILFGIYKIKFCNYNN